jgi:hypothetical protein
VFVSSLNQNNNLRRWKLVFLSATSHSSKKVLLKAVIPQQGKLSNNTSVVPSSPPSASADFVMGKLITWLSCTNKTHTMLSIATSKDTKFSVHGTILLAGDGVLLNLGKREAICLEITDNIIGRMNEILAGLTFSRVHA